MGLSKKGSGPALTQILVFQAHGGGLIFRPENVISGSAFRAKSARNRRDVWLKPMVKPTDGLDVCVQPILRSSVGLEARLHLQVPSKKVCRSTKRKLRHV